MIRHRACSLKDTAHAIFASELDPEFDRMCEEIKEARRKRGKEVFQSLNNTHLLLYLYTVVQLKGNTIKVDHLSVNMEKCAGPNI